MTVDCAPCEEAALASEVDAPVGKAAKWSGPIGMEGHRTGDGRLIKLNALRWENMPIPLRYVAQDHGAHDGAVVVGRIDDIERLTFDEANQRLTDTGRDPLPESLSDATIIWGTGVHDLGSDAGVEARRLVKEGMQPGISMDLDDVVIEEEDADSFSILEGRVRAATGVAIPAFDGARISVDEESVEQFSEDEFNWVEDAGGLPEYIKRIATHLKEKGMLESHAIATAVNVVKKMCATGDVNFPGAQQVNAGSRAEACAAVADWEAKKAASAAEDVLVASAAHVFDKSWFQNPRLTEPTAIVVTDEGQIFGHIAAWDTCHIANPQGRNVCTSPPKSRTNYAYFHTGAVATDDGEQAVGKITMNTLHAGPRLNNIDAQHHYEHTGAVGAYVVAGEDAYGIWIAGAVHPDADLTTLKAAPISGDWRTVRGNLELVSALSVNIPGFPVPRPQALVASGNVQSLVASGMIEPTNRQASLDLDDDQVLALRERFKAMDNKEKAASLAAQVRRDDSLIRIRRMASYTKQFAYDSTQWRMPKGNGSLSGQWIDMPDSLISDITKDYLGKNMLEGYGPDKKQQAALKKSLKPMDAKAKELGQALKDGDGDKAHAIAGELSTGLRDWLDNEWSPAWPPQKPEDAGDKSMHDRLKYYLDQKVEHINTLYRDSDLSLLDSETDIGHDPQTDIDNEDALTNGVDEEGNITHDNPWAVLGALPIGAIISQTFEGEGEVQYIKTADDGWIVYQSNEADLPVGSNAAQSDPEVITAGGDAELKIVDAEGGNEPPPTVEYTGQGETGHDEKMSTRRRSVTLAKVRRTAQQFEYNENQWRVPKGNPDAGQWIDMPDLAVDDLASSLEHMANSADLNDQEATLLGDSIADAQNFSQQAADAIKANDGEAANGFAKQADESLSKIEAQLHNHADNGTIDENTASDLGDSLDKARNAVSAVADNDLSLLGDTGVDTPETDIGGPDASKPPAKEIGDIGAEAPKTSEPSDADLLKEFPAGSSVTVPGKDGNPVEGEVVGTDGGSVMVSVDGGSPIAVAPNKVQTSSGEGTKTADAVPDTPNASPANAPQTPTGSEQQKAGNDAESSAGILEQTLQDVANVEDMADPEQVGAAMENFREALADLNAGIQDGNYNAADLTKTKNALSQLEAVLMNMADQPGLSDDTANQIGTALDDVFAKVASLEGTLKGDMTPPPFAGRSFSRQWLGRRGIRLTTFSMR